MTSHKRMKAQNRTADSTDSGSLRQLHRGAGEGHGQREESQCTVPGTVFRTQVGSCGVHVLETQGAGDGQAGWPGGLAPLGLKAHPLPLSPSSSSCSACLLMGYHGNRGSTEKVNYQQNKVEQFGLWFKTDENCVSSVSLRSWLFFSVSLGAALCLLSQSTT